MAKAKKIRTFLWFNEDVKSVAQHYKRVFKSDFELIKKTPGVEAKEPASSYEFRVLGNHIVAFKGNGEFKFTPAVSFMIVCKDQKEINKYWNRLVEGGTPGQCGWLTDKFGVSWQVVPNGLPKLLSHKDEETQSEIHRAFMAMSKIEISGLKIKPKKKEKPTKAAKPVKAVKSEKSAKTTKQVPAAAKSESESTK